MKKIIIVFLLAALPAFAYALEVPQLKARVNDYASMLSRETVQKLESRLESFEKSDSTQIVVLTMPGLEGENIEEFSIKVAEAWKIGQAGKDNGAILLIARDDRTLRIEVGRGLEGKLTDLMAGRIIRGEITPRFKAGDFSGGIEAGVAAMISVVKGEYSPSPSDEKKHAKAGRPLFTFVLFFFFVTMIIGGISRIFGGISGAVGLPIVSALAFPGISLLALGLLIPAGFAGGFIMSLMSGRRAGGSGWFPSGGGFFPGGGGGFFDGGSSGGGFSGGGGSFGGGGSSGSW